MRINANEAFLSQVAGRKADAANESQGTVKPLKADEAQAAAAVESSAPADAATAAVAAQNARAAVSVALRTGREVSSIVARSTFDLRI